jgi:E3 ubiquitin-protein ligase mind-bomb
VKKDDGFSALHLAALNGHSHVCEVLVKEGQADIDIRNDRRQTPFLLAVSQGHAAAVEKLVELGCDILAKDEDGDNAMHLTIIKKANLVQEVPQQEAPKIYEIYQQLGHIQEQRLMFTLLCYLAQEGCKMEPNYKGARIFDWIPEPDVRELILNYEKKHQQRILPASASSAANNASGSSNDCNQSREQMTELYNNIEMMNLTSQDSATLSSSANAEQDNSGGSSSMANCNTINNSSNPPTPARRNRNVMNNTMNNNNNNNINNNNNNNPQQPRDSSTPPLALSEDEKKLNTEIGRNLPNRNHTISPPPVLLHNEPTTSSSTIQSNIETSNCSPNRNSSQSPPLPMSSKHVSRKQQINQKMYPASQQQQQSFNGKPQLQAPQECIVCNEISLLITFEPCGHHITCEDCGFRMKKCLQCHSVVDKRIAMNGKLLLPKETQRHPSADRLKYLEHKIMEIEETHSCGICMERRKNVAFLCGHSACSKCAETLKTCHM